MNSENPEVLRADAARNRAAITEAAATLFRRDGAATRTSQVKSFTLLQETGEGLLQRAVAAGSARSDVSITELLLMVNAIANAAADGAADAARLLAYIREGVMPRGHAAAGDVRP